MVSQHGGQELDFFHGSSGAERCGGRRISRVLGRTLTSEGLELLSVRQVTKASPDSMERTQMGCLSGRSGKVCEPPLISHKFYEKCSSLKEIFERILEKNVRLNVRTHPNFLTIKKKSMIYSILFSSLPWLILDMANSFSVPKNSGIWGPLIYTFREFLPYGTVFLFLLKKNKQDVVT